METRDSPEEILRSLTREINSLTDPTFSTRLKALEKIAASTVFRKPPLKPCKIYSVALQQIFEELCKPILRVFSDERERCRELAITILKEQRIFRFVSKVESFIEMMQYIMPVLVERLSAYDMEGLERVPEVMRPSPSQKPQALIDPPEKSEEMRLLIAELVGIILHSCPLRQIVEYLDETVSVLRALAMDPANPLVMIEACQQISYITRENTELLHHYSEPIARSTFQCLVHKHARVRCAGLDALNSVMYCGCYKYNANVVEALVGFRDPNVVPIKDFYEPSTKYNYLAMLVQDRSSKVRETFFHVIGDMLTNLPDRFDHESRLIPYLLSGLYDPLPEIQMKAFQEIEQLGQMYEVEKEKEIREIRQFGFQEPWTFDGLMVALPLPYPFEKRPRLGARLYFRQYVRRYLNAIFTELIDWISASRVRASNLLLSLIIFTEDYITQYLDNFLRAMYKCINVNDPPEVLKQVKSTIKLAGRYINCESYVPQVISALKGEIAEADQDSVLKVLGLLIQGTTEALPPDLGISRFDTTFEQLLEGLDVVVPQVQQSGANEVLDIMQGFLVKISNEAEDLGNLGKIYVYAKIILDIVLRSEAGCQVQAIAQEKSDTALRALFDILQHQEKLEEWQKGHFEEIIHDFLLNLEQGPVEH